MRDIILKIFRTKYTNPIITLFNIYHIMYIIILIGLSIGLYFIYRNKEEKIKKKFIDILANILIFLLLSDYLICCLYENGIMINRLPFHMCTLFGILIPLTRFDKHLIRFQNSIAICSILAGFFYFVYPGTAINKNAFCYTAIQTIFYHSILMMYGIFTILFENKKLDFKKEIVNVIFVVLFVVLWASMGNYLYPGYDFFFLEGTTFKPYVPFIESWIIYLLLPMGFVISSLVIFLINKLVNNKK